MFQYPHGCDFKFVQCFDHSLECFLLLFLAFLFCDLIFSFSAKWELAIVSMSSAVL